MKTNQKQKNNWEMKKLGEVSDIGSGNSAPQKKKFFKNGKFPFFRTSDVGRVKISKSLKKVLDYLNDEGAKGLKFFKKGTILLPKSGASTFLNHRVIMGVDGYVVSHLATIKTNEKILNNFFLFYFLQEIKAQDLIQDHKYPSLNLSVIKQIKIPLPSLSEQKRIVGILDGVFEKIEKAKGNTEKNLQNTKKLFESYLQNVFENKGKDWEEKKIKNIAEIIKKQNKKDLPFVGMEDIESGSAKFLGVLENRSVKSSSFYFNCNHILYGRLRPYLNKILLPDFEGHCSTEIFPILVKKDLNREFLFYWFLNQKTVDKINKTCTGTRMPRAKMKEVFEFYISYPKSLITQKQIVAKLDKLSAHTKMMEKFHSKNLKNLAELKKSLLKKAFNGEL